ncbi:MAG TPA: SRPBCC family protein [Acidimicrobiales bacterium]|jgi:carbon monoxide dehydrogenase subunit G|nr:SRPBCC family protein [Acidimicrobiales bacterium]
MASAQAAIDIKKSPDEVWAVIGDFGGIADWMPGIESCRVEGENRILAMTGMEITERLVSTSDDAHTQTYCIVDGVPVESHSATITVSADGDGSKVTWDVEARPDDMAGLMQGMYQQTLDALKAKLEG